MVKTWKVRFGKRPPSGYKANEIVEISNTEKQRLEKEKAGMHVINSAFWKEDAAKPKPKPKPKSKAKKKKSKGDE